MSGEQQQGGGRHRRPKAVGVAVGVALGVLLATGAVAATRFVGSPESSGDEPAAFVQPSVTAASAGPSREPSPTPGKTSRSPSKKASAKPSPSKSKKTSGYPGPDDTGVPEGTKLRTVGEVTITKAGTVLEGVKAKCVIVRASNVTVRKSLIRGGSCGSARQFEVADNVKNVLIEDVEIDGAKVHARGAGLGGSGFTCRRCDIHGMARGVQPNDNVVIEDSWIHDLYGTSNSENAAFQSNGGSHLVIRGSNLEMNEVPFGGMALALIGDYAVLDDILVENNLFNGGGSYAIWAGDAADDKDPKFKARNTRFLNNAFGRKIYPKCGYYGPVAGWDGSMPGNRWSGNHWLDSGKKIVA
ncbi:hypothetical protein [Actinoplanes sp. NPDC023714]|uniref:right-handed parallel beta-helix repeat-containing protein n=1 Tax=Actinoplanes sp. NPDC023714 TaxID=3154322 RepID=UPI0033D8A5F0